MSDRPLPRYPQSARPRDLRTAAELAERGYHDLGQPQARLQGDDGEVLLYSTSEARRRRDPLWARPGRGAPVSAPAGPSDLEPLTRGVDRSWIARLFERDFVVLDTETTGLGRHDEIIEVGVVSARGTTLLETLVWPSSGRVPAGARRVHGLGIEDLRGAPTWREVLPELRSVLAGRRVLAWNAPFDERMARQSSRAWHLDHGLPAFECAMRAYARALGVPGGRRKLQLAAAERGVAPTARQHRSIDDARLTLAVLASLADGDPG